MATEYKNLRVANVTIEAKRNGKPVVFKAGSEAEFSDKEVEFLDAKGATRELTKDESDAREGRIAKAEKEAKKAPTKSAKAAASNPMGDKQ